MDVPASERRQRFVDYPTDYLAEHLFDTRAGAPAALVSVPPMPAPSRRLVVTALALTVSVSGCGKSLPGEAGGEASSKAIAPVSPQGAGGVATKNTTRLGGIDVATDAAAVAVAVHSGLTAAGRPEAVVIVDERDWPGALAAAALAAAPLRAPLLYSDGGTLPEASGQALRTMRPTGAPALGGAQVLEIAATASGRTETSGYRTRTVIGSNPYAQAVEIERLMSAAQGKAPRAVIVAAADGPSAQAMPAAALAAQNAAPILLVGSTSLPAATGTELRRLHRPSIYVVGSTAAVSGTVVSALGKLGPVKRIVSPIERIGREDPVDNAIAVALFSDGGFGWGVDEPGHGLVFANASRPLDAPASASLAASGDYAPLLLLASPHGVPATLSEYLLDIRPGYSEAPAYRAVHGAYNHGWLIGGEDAISAKTQAELDSMLEIAPQTTTTTTSAATTSAGTTSTTTSTGTTSTTTSTGTVSPSTSTSAGTSATAPKQSAPTPRRPAPTTSLPLPKR